MTIKEFKDILRRTYKSRDTEENIDVYFTRPVGLLIALACKRLDVHPNAVTVVSIFLGAGAGFMFWHTDLWHNVCGVLLLLAANFCDSADGQLARMTGKKTLMGRMLDGFSSDVWFLSVYVAICLRLQNQPIPGLSVRWGIGIWLLCALAGFVAHARQARLADYYRNIHLFFLLGGEGSELSSYESQRAIYKRYKSEGDLVGVLFFYNYANYCRAQEAATPQFQRLKRRLVARYGSLDDTPPEVRAEFLRGSLPLMKYANFLTHNWRSFILFFGCLANIPWIYPLFEITVMYAVFVCMHRRHEDLCRSMCRGGFGKAYIFDYGATLDTLGEHWSEVLWRSYRKAGVPVERRDFWEAYCATERRLGEDDVIQPDFTFRRTLETKVEMQLQRLADGGKLSAGAGALIEMRDKIVRSAYEETLQVTAGAREALRRLRDGGSLIAVVSNFYGNLRTVLDEFDLAPYVDEVVESATAGVRKPDPHIWRLGVEALRRRDPALRPQDITVVGDSQEKDIAPAKTLGCKTILRGGKPLIQELLFI